MIVAKILTLFILNGCVKTTLISTLSGYNTNKNNSKNDLFQKLIDKIHNKKDKILNT